MPGYKLVDLALNPVRILQKLLDTDSTGALVKLLDAVDINRIQIENVR